MDLLNFFSVKGSIMNKLTKITTTALFALFLTACDKLAPKDPEVAKAETTVSETAIKEQEKADFQKIIEWNNSQQEALAHSQMALQETISTGDRIKIEESLNAFNTKVDEVLKSLETVDVKSELLIQFKNKMKETLSLSNDLIAESVKAMSNPTLETQKVIQAKTQTLINAGQELEKFQAQLQQRFMPELSMPVQQIVEPEKQ